MKKVMIAGLVVALLLGCGGKRDTTAFVIIDGEPLTAADLKEIVELKAKMAKISGGTVPEDFEKWANETAWSLVAPMIKARLLDKEISRLELNPTADDVSRTLAAYNTKLNLKAKTPDEMGDAFGDMKAVFLGQFDISARKAAYERLFWMPKVSDAMVKTFIQSKAEAAVRARKVDEAVLQKGREAYRRLKAGEAWEKVAHEMSEDRLVDPKHERFAKEWFWADADGLHVPALASALASMKVGDYTSPIEMADGLSIMRLIEVRGSRYHLARIFFRMSRRVRVPRSDAEAKEWILSRSAEACKKQTFERLLKGVRLEFPLGTNFTYRIWQ